MKKLALLFGWVIPILFLTNCKKEYSLGNDPSIESVEQYVRDTRDAWAVFSYSQYNELLTELQKDKYKVLSVNNFRHYSNDSLVVVALRHDIDWHPFKALEMAQMEQDHGLTSTWYVLPTAPYFAKYSIHKVERFTSMIPLYKDIENTGCEIGIHNDLLTAMVTYKLLPFEVNKNDLKYFQKYEIQIYGSAAHGSIIAQKTNVNNYEMYSDFTTRSSFTYRGKVYSLGSYTLKEYGFQYEAYHLNYDEYLSDVGGVWNAGDGSFKAFLNKLKSLPRGTRVEILVHPVWWGK